MCGTGARAGATGNTANDPGGVWVSEARWDLPGPVEASVSDVS